MKAGERKGEKERDRGRGKIVGRSSQDKVHEHRSQIKRNETDRHKKGRTDGQKKGRTDGLLRKKSMNIL